MWETWNIDLHTDTIQVEQFLNLHGLLLPLPTQTQNKLHGSQQIIYCLCQALLPVHSIIGASERLCCNLWFALCKQNYILPFSWSWSVLNIPCYFELVNATDDYAMAGTATSDALAQVRNLIVIFGHMKKITVRKNWFDGQTSLKNNVLSTSRWNFWDTGPW